MILSFFSFAFSMDCPSTCCLDCCGSMNESFGSKNSFSFSTFAVVWRLNRLSLDLKDERHRTIISNFVLHDLHKQNELFSSYINSFRIGSSLAGRLNFAHLALHQSPLLFLSFYVMWLFVSPWLRLMHSTPNIRDEFQSHRPLEDLRCKRMFNRFLTADRITVSTSAVR